MKIMATKLTRALRGWLTSSHDDGHEPLRVEQVGPDIDVTRADGSELSAAEELEITARLAAHAVEPLKDFGPEF